jgi:hypothetical protein
MELTVTGKTVRPTCPQTCPSRGLEAAERPADFVLTALFEGTMKLQRS